jgi:putative ABC transport system permease protein
VVAPLRLPETSYADPRQAAGFFTSLLEGVAAIPGVTAVAGVSSAPFAGPNSGLIFGRADRPAVDRQQAPDADYRVVTPGYLATMGIPLLRGRDFTAQDAPGVGDLGIISETMARRYWPDEDPLGKRFRTGDLVDGKLVTIIGVAGDARYQSLETPEAKPMVYFSTTQSPLRGMSLVVRTSDATSLVSGLRRIIASLDATLAPPPISEMSALVRDAFGTRRFALVLFAIFAAVATLLAGIGIYGVMAFLVRERTHELGIRVALGAPQGRLMASVVGRALRMTLGGVSLGLLGAWMLTKSLEALLFQIDARDTTTFLAVAVFVSALGVLASIIPARRAMKADPMEALRSD